jgi:Helix-turn-helix domain
VWDAVKAVIRRGPQLDLDHLEFRVLLYLADRLNKRTGQLNPSPERLALDCGLDARTAERSIRRALRRLESKGLVERVGSRWGGRQEGGHYPTQQYRLRLGGTSGPPSDEVRGDTDDSQGGHEVRLGGTSGPPNLGFEPGKKNLPSGSTTRLASPLNGDASAATPSAAGRISDDLLAQVQEVDPGAERKTRHDGSQWIELSDGEPLPNAQRAVMFCRYAPETRWWT